MDEATLLAIRVALQDVRGVRAGLEEVKAGIRGVHTENQRMASSQEEVARGVSNVNNQLNRLYGRRPIRMLADDAVYARGHMLNLVSAIGSVTAGIFALRGGAELGMAAIESLERKRAFDRMLRFNVGPDNAKRIEKQTEDFAFKQGLDINAMRPGVAKLAGTKEVGADDLVPLLRAFSAVAAESGADSQQTTRAFREFAEMASIGHLDRRTMRALANDQVQLKPIFENLIKLFERRLSAKPTGIGDNAQISFKEAAAALLEYGKDPKNQKFLDEQAGQASASIQRLKNVIETDLLPAIGEKLAPEVTKVAGELTDWIKSIDPQQVEQVTQELLDFGEKLVEYAPQIAIFIGALVIAQKLGLAKFTVATLDAAAALDVLAMSAKSGGAGGVVGGEEEGGAAGAAGGVGGAGGPGGKGAPGGPGGSGGSSKGGGATVFPPSEEGVHGGGKAPAETPPGLTGAPPGSGGKAEGGVGNADGSPDAVHPPPRRLGPDGQVMKSPKRFGPNGEELPIATPSASLDERNKVLDAGRTVAEAEAAGATVGTVAATGFAAKNFPVLGPIARGVGGKVLSVGGRIVGTGLGIAGFAAGDYVGQKVAEHFTDNPWIQQGAGIAGGLVGMKGVGWGVQAARASWAARAGAAAAGSGGATVAGTAAAATTAATTVGIGVILAEVGLLAVAVKEATVDHTLGTDESLFAKMPTWLGGGGLGMDWSQRKAAQNEEGKAAFEKWHGRSEDFKAFQKNWTHIYGGATIDRKQLETMALATYNQNPDSAATKQLIGLLQRYFGEGIAPIRDASVNNRAAESATRATRAGM
jgi:hypothetical protein